ncbi:MAG: YtoQ family protein [Candidatus Poribacteria bacterium]|nr:YtoQ family protein [Candidatus Poribacteria bacterium]
MNNTTPHVVYLSSSAHSDWREPVKAKYLNDDRVVFVGPCEQHGLSDAMGAPGDVKPGHKLRIMQMLSKSDVLFGYIPDDRYRSFNIMLEIGLARAWGRKILFVNEARSLDEEVRSAQAYVDESFDGLQAGLNRLHQLIASENDRPSPEVGQLVKPTGRVTHQIFLSGSSEPGWINRVQARYRDHAEVTLTVEEGMDALTSSDILLACRTNSESRLFNLSLAVGYASALGKRILFVNEGDHYSHAYDYIKPFSDGYFTDLDEGLRYLDYAVGIEDRL